MPLFPITLASEGLCVRDLLPERTSHLYCTYILYFPFISNVNKKIRLKPIPEIPFEQCLTPLPPASLRNQKKNPWGSALFELHQVTRRCPMFHATFSEISNDATFRQIHLPFLTCFIATWQSPLRSWSKCQTYVPGRHVPPKPEITGLLRSY